MAAYMAGRWKVSVTVVTAVTSRTSQAQLDEAQEYISSKGIKNAKFILKELPIAEAIIEESKNQKSSLIIMGGFSYRPLRHLVLGSTAEKVLRTSEIPVLICR